MDYIKVGKLKKSFGTKGHIRVSPEKAFWTDLASSDVWFVESGGEIVPYFVEEIESDKDILVKFEEVDSPESAKKITGSILHLRQKDITFRDTPEEDNFEKLVGFTIYDEQISIGKVDAIEEYPQQLMAIVKLMGTQEKVLIPLSPEMIVDINISGQSIVMNLPDGLINSQL